MNVIEWPKGLQPTYAAIKKHKDIILGGTVLAIDPSSGSANSMPGFSIWTGAELVLSGTIKIDSKKVIYHRLTDLYFKIFELTEVRPDVLVIESVNKMQAHAFLLWAVGVSIAAAAAPVSIEIHNCLWKAVAKATPAYKKSDAADAEMMGRAVILLAKKERDKNVNSELLPGGPVT